MKFFIIFICLAFFEDANGISYISFDSEGDSILSYFNTEDNKLLAGDMLFDLKIDDCSDKEFICNCVNSGGEKVCYFVPVDMSKGEGVKKGIGSYELYSDKLNVLPFNTNIDYIRLDLNLYSGVRLTLFYNKLRGILAIFERNIDGVNLVEWSVENCGFLADSNCE